VVLHCLDHDPVLLGRVGHLHAPRASNGSVRDIAIPCVQRRRGWHQQQA
jgi:hypothetical protein